MTITQTVKIPDDYRIFLEIPRSVPSGTMAKISINVPSGSPKSLETPENIVEIRQLLQKEMAEKGTTSIKASSGDGWETHVKEQYAQS